MRYFKPEQHDLRQGQGYLEIPNSGSRVAQALVLSSFSLLVSKSQAPYLVLLFSSSFNNVFYLRRVKVQVFVFWIRKSNGAFPSNSWYVVDMASCTEYLTPPLQPPSPHVKCIYDAFYLLEGKINCIKH